MVDGGKAEPVEPADEVESDRPERKSLVLSAITDARSGIRCAVDHSW